MLILTLITCILNRILTRTSTACRPLSPISVLLTLYVRRIRRRFHLLGLVRIFPRFLASIASIFPPLSFSQLVGINVFLAPSLITILSIYLFPQSMKRGILLLIAPIAIVMIGGRSPLMLLPNAEEGPATPADPAPSSGATS